jgi:protein-S-isoprenylcysteine O-methyltransferase Ste14
MEADGRRRRAIAAVGTLAFLVLAPGTVAVLLPWTISRWRVHAPFPGFAVLRVAGVTFVVTGACVLLESFAQFALHGLGTPAPPFPTKRLVVTGFYRLVRNPMYVAVVSIVLGQALFLGSVDLLLYGLCVWLVTHLFVLLYEEPKLKRSFGAEYDDYSAHVRRWIPRLNAWQA